MINLQTGISVDAPPAKVWPVLVDFASYPAWNTFIPRIAGRVAPGARLDVSIRLADDQMLTFRPTVVAAEHERMFGWHGRLLVPTFFGLPDLPLDGGGSFELESSGGRTRFIHVESFTGSFTAMMRRSQLDEVRHCIEAMNAALKRRVESVTAKVS